MAPDTERTHERQGEEYDERPLRPDDQHGEGRESQQSAEHDRDHGPAVSQDHSPVDMAPSADRIMHLIPRIGDDQLDLPTPCEGRTVRQLLGHLVGLTRAFRATAEKDLGEWTDTDPDAEGWPDAPDDWREVLAEQLPALVTAWYPATAWQGMTRAGGVDLPGGVAGAVALSELTLHGWDLARAVGHDYQSEEPTVEALEAYVGGFDPAGTPGLFGPAVEPPSGATAFERLVARSGRDPAWSPSGEAA